MYNNPSFRTGSDGGRCGTMKNTNLDNKRNEKEFEVRVRDKDRDTLNRELKTIFGLNINEGAGDDDSEGGGVGILYPILTFISSAPQGLLRMFGCRAEHRAETNPSRPDLDKSRNQQG